MPDVDLVDLDVIKRYSLAIRQESAPAEEVLAALELSVETVLAALGGPPAQAVPVRQPRTAKKGAAKARASTTKKRAR